MSVFKTRNLLIDLQRKSLSVLSDDGTIVHQDIVIAPLTWAVLYHLVCNAPERLSIDKLIELCWENTVVSDETVVQRIALLRKILEKYGIAASGIENVRGVGYRWVPEVSEVKTPQKPILTLSHKLKSGLILGSIFLILCIFIGFYQLSEMEVLVTPESVTPESNSAGVKELQSAAPQSKELLQQAHSYRQRFDAQSMSFAVSLYEKVLQNDPENVSALAGLTFALCHQVSKFNQEQNHHTGIARIAQKALQLAPDNPFVLQANGLARDVIGDIDGAIDFYSKALTLNSEEPSLYGDLAYLYTIKGKLALAAEFHLKSLSGVQQFRQSQLALWLHLLGERNSAGYWYEQAVLLNPHNLTDKLSYLDWLLKTAQFTSAIEYAVTLQEQGIEDHRLWLLLAKAYFLASDQDKASNAIQTTLKLQPGYAEGLLWQRIIGGVVKASSDSDTVRQFYSDLQYPWPEHLVAMAIYQRYSDPYSLSQTRTNQTPPAHDTKKILQYLTSAVEHGYRDAEWLQRLVSKSVLPDTPKIRQIITEIERRRDSENQKLEQNIDYQNLLNRTAREIVN